MLINNRLNKNCIFFSITLIFLYFISINNTKNFHILTYSVPAYAFKDSYLKNYAYGLGTYGFKNLALNAFSETHELTLKNSIRHINFTSNYQISWLVSKEKFFKIKKELTPEKLLDISIKIYTYGDINKNYIKYLNFLLDFDDITKFEINYDKFTNDFYINYNNMKISYINRHLLRFEEKEYEDWSETLGKDQVKKIIKNQSMNKEDIKEKMKNNYFGSYKLDLKDKNFTKSLLSNEEIEFSNINFTSKDVYKISERYIKNNSYFYTTPSLKEKEIIIVENNKIKNLKITDCKIYSYMNGLKLNCKYFPLQISKDGLNFNFF